MIERIDNKQMNLRKSNFVLKSNKGREDESYLIELLLFFIKKQLFLTNFVGSNKRVYNT